MDQTGLEYLYEWKLLDEKKGNYEESCYMEEELKLMHYGIRSKIIPLKDENGYAIWVPLKDFEVAWDVFHNNVKEVIDLPKETYHVFEKDLSYRNKSLYENKYKVSHKYMRSKYYFYLGIILLSLFALFRFVKF